MHAHRPPLTRSTAVWLLLAIALWGCGDGDADTADAADADGEAQAAPLSDAEAAALEEHLLPVRQALTQEHQDPGQSFTATYFPAEAALLIWTPDGDHVEICNVVTEAVAELDGPSGTVPVWVVTDDDPGRTFNVHAEGRGGESCTAT